MTIERKHPFGALPPDRLPSFERELPAPLPEDYRAFLVDFNGARFSSSTTFHEVEGGTALESLFGLHAGPEHRRLDALRRSTASLVPSSLLLIGDDAFGNYFGMSLVGPHRGAIFFIDHERMPVREEGLQRLALSFAELLRRTGDAVDAPVTHPSITVAIARGDADAVDAFIRSGAALTRTVHVAVRAGRIDVLRSILDAGGDPDERGGADGMETPLFTAAEVDRADMAELLLARGADPTLRNASDTTALDVARYHPAVQRILLRATGR